MSLAALAKPEMKAYRKRELRFLLLTETGAGAARYSAPHGCRGFIFSQPRPIATMGRGILLSGVRRQQQHHSQYDKRDHDQTSHGRAPFPACAAPSAGSRVKRSSRAVCVIAYPFPSGNAGSRWKIIAIGRLDAPVFRVFRDVSYRAPCTQLLC